MPKLKRDYDPQEVLRAIETRAQESERASNERIQRLEAERQPLRQETRVRVSDIIARSIFS